MSKEQWSRTVETNEDELKLFTGSFTVSSVDGYVESPGNFTVEEVSPLVIDGYYKVTLPETFAAVRFVKLEVLTDGEDDADCARVRGIDADNGIIYVQTQSTPGTDAALANGSTVMLLLAGVKQGTAEPRT
jgi:hypothetical protein